MLRVGKSWIGGMQRSTSKEIIITNTFCSLSGDNTNTQCLNLSNCFLQICMQFMEFDIRNFFSAFIRNLFLRLKSDCYTMGCVAFGNNFLLKFYCKNLQAHSTPCGCLDRLRKLLDYCRKNPSQLSSILTACKFHLLLVISSNCKANLILFGMKMRYISSNYYYYRNLRG